MLQITPQMRILAAIEPVDFRKGIDALAQLCKQKLETDPFSGCLFLFRSRSATAIKILVYDSQGFWIAQKRLSSVERPLQVVAGRPCSVAVARSASGADAAGSR